MAEVIVFSAKDPGETKMYSFDFSDDMESDETIESATALVNYVNGSGDPNDLSTYLSGDPLFNSCGSNVQQAFGGGLHLSIYDLRITATTSIGQVLVRVGRISVVRRM